MSRTTHLKVKIKTLAAEAAIIRTEEHKARNAARSAVRRVSDGHGADPAAHYQRHEGLYRHRIDVVRPAARVNLLAYGCLRRTSYASMESKTRTYVDFHWIRKLVQRFGTAEDQAYFETWYTEAAAHLDAQGVNYFKLTFKAMEAA